MYRNNKVARRKKEEQKKNGKIINDHDNAKEFLKHTISSILI